MAICLETIDSSHSLLICWREREKGRLNELIDLEKVWGSLAQKILPKTKTSAHVLHLVWKPSFNFSLNSFQNSCSARHLCFLTIIKYALKAHYILGTVVGKRKHGLNFSTLMKFNKFLFPPKLFLEAVSHLCRLSLKSSPKCSHNMLCYFSVRPYFIAIIYWLLCPIAQKLLKH